MTDLPTPAYGSLSCSEECTMYLNKRPKWLRYVAKSAGSKLALLDAPSIRERWQRMREDYQRAVWKNLSVADRAVVKKAFIAPQEQSA